MAKALTVNSCETSAEIMSINGVNVGSISSVKQTPFIALTSHGFLECQVHAVKLRILHSLHRVKLVCSTSSVYKVSANGQVL